MEIDILPLIFLMISLLSPINVRFVLSTLKNVVPKILTRDEIEAFIGLLYMADVDNLWATYGSQRRGVGP